MNITEVRIFRKETVDKKLRAFATITFDDAFVVRDIKVIEGAKGLFVAMPSRKAKVRCPSCSHSSSVGSKFCGNCGKNIESISAPRIDPNAHKQGEHKQGEHKDIAHPITLECREYIQKKVLDAYEQDKNRGPVGSVAPGAADDPD